MSMDHGLNRLYTEYFSGEFRPIAIPLPNGVGSGTIAQAVTNHGIVVSEWDMKYHDTITVEGESREEYAQFLFCMEDGVSWQMDGNRRDFTLEAAEACVYRGTGQAEHLCYMAQREYAFKGMKIPVRYLENILEEYFEPDRAEIYRRTLFDEFTKIRISPCIEHIFSEIQGVNGYAGGLRRLFLDSKIQELFAVILSEVLEIEHTERLSPPLGKSDIEAVKSAKLIHAYVIDRRLEAAACLLIDSGYTVTQAALAVGYSKPSNFSAAFKRKYGVVSYVRDI